MSKSAAAMFVKEVIARMKGDENEVIAISNYRKAKAGLKTQISIKEGELVDLEEKADNAHRDLQAATFPIDKVENGNDYVVNLISKKNALEEAKDAVADHVETINFLKAKLAEITSGDTEEK